MFANCLHDLAALGPGGLAALLAALFLAGLAGGATHCAGMCSPFVLVQVAAGADRHGGGSLLRRLSGAALLPYHLGRMVGYGALGALAGTAAGLVAMASGLRFFLAVLLAVAAVLMLFQAGQRLGAARWLAWLPPMPAARLPTLLQPPLARLMAMPQGWRGLLLGLMLSALPCGLLYGALAAAAAAGSALAGALAMIAFVAGTMPSLIGVALLGKLFGRRSGPLLRYAGAALFLLNGTVLATMAWRVAV